MATTPPDDWGRNDGPFVQRPPTVPPEDYRPVRAQSASGPEQTYVRDGKRYTFRQVGWHGQTGAFYALDEKPSDHEPGGWSPLHLLAFVEDVIAPDDGLYAKYDVRRTDGREKPDARYFVLDYAGDPAARAALVAYADACEANQPGLAAALRAELAGLAVERMGKPSSVLIDIRRHLAGLKLQPGDTVTLAMTVDVNITDDGPFAAEPAGVTRRVDRKPGTTFQINTHRGYFGSPVGKLTPEPYVLAFDGAGPGAKPIALERDEAGQIWTVDPHALDRLFLGPTAPPAGDGDLVRVQLSPGEQITDPERAEALGLNVEARRLREARAASPDADALFIHVDEQAGTLNLTQTTGRTLAVAVNGGTAQVGDRLRHTISYRTGEVVDAEQPRCIPAAGIHVEPHVGCILR